MNLNHVEAEWEGVSGIASQATPPKMGEESRRRQETDHRSDGQWD